MANFFIKIQNWIIRVVDFFYFPIFRFIPLEIFRYGVTGGINTLFDLLLYFVFYRYILDMQVVHFGLFAIGPHIAAFFMVFPITFSTGFLLAKYITFTSSDLKGKIQLFRYGVTVAGAILLNYVFLKFFVEYAGFYATLSKAITTIIVVIYSYILQRYFSFKTGKFLIPRKVAD
ncbi:MAG: GtrA family protein [Prolixibacteraceae bacterium]|jgi:putative flippase GtrA|nr:GtrA family protein [Prolixibacteraceae bacterium]MBT6767240.1 GtrA family protein [Prolixibacteraceae bacterium]MBT6998790.1 GtrA family protein [Prolixibacteraceae bacterium]MBT7394948.1 GtrA family protein [Prolixibacteraceae bacterium]